MTNYFYYSSSALYPRSQQAGKGGQINTDLPQGTKLDVKKDPFLNPDMILEEDSDGRRDSRIRLGCALHHLTVG